MNIEALNKTFEKNQILTAEELNAITGKVDEIIGSTSSLLSENDISYTLNELSAPSTGDGSYKIGDLKIGSKVLKIYGKDFFGGNTDNPQNGGYYEIAFKTFSSAATLSNVLSSMPADGVGELSNGWAHSAENIDGRYSIWMINRYVTRLGSYGDWQGPWRISGANGENGIDGDTMEYIYRRTVTQDAPDGKDSTIPLYNDEVHGQTPDDDDFVPLNWTDNPRGVSPDNRYEWMAFRTKTGAQQGIGGTWSPFMGPILWSSYGRNGTDGDGIEYIFCAKIDGETYDAQNSPDTWPLNQEREYIPSNAIEWSDDPIDIETLGMGARQWVSIRRKYADSEPHPTYGTEPYWHAYSAPSLWSYYAKDGRAEGIIHAVLYSVLPKFSSVSVNYGEQEDTVTGTIQWMIMRSEGTNITFVGPSNEYNITTKIFIGNVPYSGIAYSNDAYSVTFPQIEYTGQERFMQIVAYEDNIPVASAIVPVIIPGRDGSNGIGTQGLQGEVLRVRGWMANPTVAYNDGTILEDGIRFIDIVELNGSYYKCLRAGTSETPGSPINVADPCWTLFNAYNNGWFDTLIANSAYVRNLTAKLIIVTSNATNNNEGDIPVAGMLNGNIIPTQLTGKTNNNGIRIFAGTIPSNGDVSSAPFTVDNTGKLRATNAEITGTVTATQGTFSNCTIDNSCTIQGMAVPVAIIANLRDVINLPLAPDGTIYNILVMSTANAMSGNSVEVRCATYNVQNGLTDDAMFEFYNGEWHIGGQALPQNRHTYCQVVGLYMFVRKDGDWYAIFPY